MCLLIFAWRQHPRYPLVLAGNRDEFHERPAGPAGWWSSPPGLLAGRDLQAGGTWLGVTRGGRFGVVTNFREPDRDTSGSRSRGELVVDFLSTPLSPAEWAAELATRQDEYGGYNLIVGDTEGIRYLTNRGEDVHDLPPGVYGLSNHRLDTPWPKVVTAKEGLVNAIGEMRLAREPLFRILADRETAADGELPDTGLPLDWERKLSSAFIVSPRYGTRVSTVMLIDESGEMEFEERRFNAAGEQTGESVYEGVVDRQPTRTLMDEDNPVYTGDRLDQAPCGSWPSPISAGLIVEQGVRLFQPQLHDGRAYWLETRPREEGRTVLVGEGPDGEPVDLSPANCSVRSRVHEYGGGAYRVDGDDIWFVENGDQAIYRVRSGEAPQRITSEPDHRHADLVVDRNRSRVICVCEDHGVTGEPGNFLAAIDRQGRKSVLASGDDFYSSPRISPDGARIAWVSWRHPNLPWDGTELWVAGFDEDGATVDPMRVAGGPGESVCQPAWGPDGRLFFVSDRNDWWNLYAHDGKRVSPVVEMHAEIAWPQWVFGQSAYGFPDDENIMFAATSGGRWHVYRASLETGEPAQVQCPWDHIEHLVSDGPRTLMIAGGPDRALALVELTDAGSRTIIASSDTVVPGGFLSRPESISFPTAEGQEAHGLFYPPVNAAWHPRDGERPPLLIKCHGGPTGATGTAQDLRTQFWTSRGFGVLDVNYRGSTGFGRAYRRSLYGRWGKADVEDCLAGARALADAGRIDGDRLLISGGSAGGYTVLCALTFTEAFTAGASHYGIGDLETMFATTHKFESRYDHWLLGDPAKSRAILRARSPLLHAKQITCPVIFFQGAKDRVVPPEQSQTMVKALHDRGLPVAYLEYPDEAHGFRRADAVRESLEAELYFFCRALGLPTPEGIEPVAIQNEEALG